MNTIPRISVLSKETSMSSLIKFQARVLLTSVFMSLLILPAVSVSANWVPIKVDDISVIVWVSDQEDTDGDGLPDDWELDNGFRPDDPGDAASDSDGDGLSNLEEYQAGSNPRDVDTDQDGIPDEYEVANGLNPASDDTALDLDGDGFSNLEEYIAGTEPGAFTADNVGALAGNAGVGPDGSASYSVPVKVPTGIAGMEPSALALTYNSQRGNGLLGMGWDLAGLSTITRCPATLVQDGFIDAVDFDDNDKFCLDGQRLVEISEIEGEYVEYRTEIESFTRIRKYGNSFKVWNKTGQVMEYSGRDFPAFEVSISCGPGCLQQALVPARSYFWAVTKISDPFGNYMTIAYHAEEDDELRPRPTRIDYTGNDNANVAPFHSVEFIYEDRDDVITQYIDGSELMLDKRLDKVNVYTGSRLKREYDLTYEPGTKQSRITSISECDGQGVCLPATQIGWDDWAKSIHEDTDSWGTRDYDTRDHETQWPVDVNSDGLIDVVYNRHDTGYYVAINNGQGLEPDVQWGARDHHVENNTQWPVDVNGDGLTDMLYQPASMFYPPHISNSYYVMLGGAQSQLAEPVQWGNHYGFGNVHHPSTQWPVDMNGDGLIDILYLKERDCSSPCFDLAPKYYVMINTGEGFGVPIYFGQRLMQSVPDVIPQWPVDMNGDGLTDVLYQAHGSNTYFVLLNGEPNSIHQWGIRNHSAADSAQWPVDMNGDGLIDILYRRSSTSDYYVLLNNGKEFEAGTLWGTRDYIAESNSTQWPVDMNGDGLVDILYKRNNERDYHVLLNNSHEGFDADLYWATRNYVVEDNKTQWPVDMNGDGLTDILYEQRDTWEYRVLYQQSSRPNVLSSITNGLGAETKFTYEPLTNSSVYTKHNDAEFPVIDYQGPLYVVSRLETSDGLGGFNRLYYEYKGLKIHVQGLGSLGFRQMTTIDIKKAIIGSSRKIYTSSYFKQDYAGRLQGTLERQWVKERKWWIDSTFPFTHTEWTWLSETTHDWTNFDLGVGMDGVSRYYRQLDKTTVSQWDLNEAFLSKTITDYVYDTSYRNLKQVTQKSYDENNAVLHTRVTDNTYSNNVSAAHWFIGQPTSATVTSTIQEQTTLKSKTIWDYDVNTGRKRWEKVINPGTIGNSETHITYTQYGRDENNNLAVDAFGHNLAVTVSGPDFESRTSYKDYSPDGRYLQSSTNDLGHIASYMYYPDNHPNAGLLEMTTGPNGIDTYYEYDSFNRKRYVTAAGGTGSAVTGTTLYTWCADAASCPANAVYFITRHSEGGNVSKTYIDALGREVRNTSTTFAGKIAIVDISYDHLGRKQTVTEPYFTGDTIYHTTYSYDDLNRITRIDSPDQNAQGVTTDYDGLVVTSTNENGQQKVIYNNPLGQMVTSEDQEGNQIHYAYDSFGKLLSTTPPDLDATVTITYDALGRKQTLNDPDLGSWQYTYNGLGQLITQTDAKGQTTCLAYDTLGRKVKQIDNYQGTKSTQIGEISQASQGCIGDESNPHVSEWVYDTAFYGLGKLGQVYGENNYWESYSYDELGRPVQMAKTLNGNEYLIDATYDLYNRLQSITYPGATDRLTVRNIYDNQGILVEVRNADTQTAYYTLDDMDASGRVTRNYYGNDVVTEHGYEASTGMLESILSYRGATDLQDLSFEFDPLGNLTRREDRLPGGFVEDFQYDNLNRLTDVYSDYGDGQRHTSTSYYASGNIDAKSNVGTYSYGGTCNGVQAGPHAVTNITGTKNASYCYDANGNMISGDGRSIEYNYFNKPTRIEDNGQITEISYDPDRNRYYRKDTTTYGVTETTYVDGLYEKVSLPDGAIEERHYVGGFAIVTHKDRGTAHATQVTHYLHKDHLDSTAVITDEFGNMVERFSYDAWGKRRAPGLTELLALGAGPDNFFVEANELTSTLARHGYTGHEHLDPVGLIHMNGRVYDAEIGRFISADILVGHPHNLQSFNRYSYVYNNPLSMTDPSGYFVCGGLCIAGVVVGVVVGAYLGGVAANSLGADSIMDAAWDPRGWDWSSPDTYIGIAAGGILGGVGAYYAAGAGTVIFSMYMFGAFVPVIGGAISLVDAALALGNSGDDYTVTTSVCVGGPPCSVDDNNRGSGSSDSDVDTSTGQPRETNGSGNSNRGGASENNSNDSDNNSNDSDNSSSNSQNFWNQLGDVSKKGLWILNRLKAFQDLMKGKYIGTNTGKLLSGPVELGGLTGDDPYQILASDMVSTLWLGVDMARGDSLAVLLAFGLAAEGIIYMYEQFSGEEENEE